tara:strand:+ start:461 stop:685 length:225 start_codon:yes stop_codon:yes gene_type:complete
MGTFIVVRGKKRKGRWLIELKMISASVLRISDDRLKFNPLEIHKEILNMNKVDDGKHQDLFLLFFCVNQPIKNV